MEYTLLIGDRAYSSGSLRGWLLFEKFGIERTEIVTRMYSEQLTRDLAAFAPSRTVPVVKCADGLVISDSLAIAEELASRHPDAGLWPKSPPHRAVARQVAAEMHSSFTSLRGHCPMNLRVAYSDCAPTDGVLADLRRLEEIWAWARAETQSATPWLCGEYSAADAMFAPVAARIAGYGLLVNAMAQAYVEAHLHDSAFRRWRAMGLASGVHQGVYDKEYPLQDSDKMMRLNNTLAKAVGAWESVNALCPYSGKAVTDYLELDGKIYGFCNPFCHDKTVADPEAWGEFTEWVIA